MNFCNKLECLLLPSLSNLIYFLCVRPVAYPRVEHLKGVSLWLLPCSQTLYYPGRLARGEHSTLLQKLVTYSRKKFYNIGPWWLKLQYILIFFCFSLPVSLDICGSLRQQISCIGVYYIISLW
jgi:hypothetical protein